MLVLNGMYDDHCSLGSGFFIPCKGRKGKTVLDGTTLGGIPLTIHKGRGEGNFHSRKK